MDKFFALFGKIILILVILGGIAYGAYYLGKTTTSGTGAASTVAQPSPSIDPGLTPEKVPTITVTPQTK